MSTLQQQTIRQISIMSDDNVSSNCGIGIAEQIDMYDPEYDFDEYNDEIALLFGASG